MLAMRKIELDCETPSNQVSACYYSLFFVVGFGSFRAFHSHIPNSLFLQRFAKIMVVSRPAVIVVVYHDCVRGITYNNVWYNLFRTEYRNIETPIFPIEVVCGTLRHNLLYMSNTTMNGSTKHSNSTNTHSDNKIADKYCLDNFSPSENDTKPVVKQDANNVLRDPQCRHGAAAVEGKKNCSEGHEKSCQHVHYFHSACLTLTTAEPWYTVLRWSLMCNLGLALCTLRKPCSRNTLKGK